VGFTRGAVPTIRVIAISSIRTGSGTFMFGNENPPEQEKGGVSRAVISTRPGTPARYPSRIGLHARYSSGTRFVTERPARIAARLLTRRIAQAAR
jgi:hypothetical protein